ncbi:MAG: hypothetical protein ACAI43_08705 [Phycisphaerae bacterium]|nr:hypothetical protein [Tepidisphaeraceae bacterium]
MQLGEKDYRLAGLARLRESGLALDSDMFAGSVYLAGRAVESMLRALIWRNDSEVRTGRKSLDTGHDLRELLQRVSNLGVLADDEHREALAEAVQRLGRLWHNNMRFFHDDKLRSYWWQIKAIRGKRTLKQAADEYYESCSAIVKRCEALCQK